MGKKQEKLKFYQGKVKLGFNKETGEEVAIKIINKSLIAQKNDMKLKLEREIAIMKVIHHPHVLTLLDVYETNDYLYVIIIRTN